MGALAKNYNRRKIAFKRGKGSFLYSTSGKKYLDFVQGIAVNSLGHANPKLIRAIQNQSRKIWHVSNAFLIPEGERLAKRLTNKEKPIKQNKIQPKLAGEGLKLDFKLKEGLDIFERPKEASKGTLNPRTKLLSMVDKPVIEKIESKGVPFADYVEDVEEGEETLLNTKEYKFAGYFSRIKRKVGPECYKRLKYETKRRDPTRKIYLNKQRITVLNIFLDTDGHFLKADILESSGVRFIDKIAIKSFIASSPFLNPPTALVNRAGEVSLKFAFIIQVDAPPLYEIFK